MSDNTTRFGISLPSELLDRFDTHIERQHYTNRSEAIRDLIRQDLVRQDWADSATPVMGTVTLVYDHHHRDMTQKLTGLQHDFGDRIITVTHVHIDHHNCLEVLIVKGPGNEIADLAQRLRSVRGVKHATLSMTTTGSGL